MKDSIEARAGRYFAGEMEEKEMAGFQKELASDPAMEQAFLSYQRIWQAQPSAPADRWDETMAWAEFERRNIVIAPKSNSRRIVAYWSIAASILLIVVASFYFLALPTPKTYLYADSSPIELNDGSKVHLNKGSAITVYPFSRKERHIELSGEAFFEVSPDAKRPFTISCGGTETEVVGTTFDIKQIKEKVQLFVNSGKVIFRSQENIQNALALKAGEGAYFENHKMQIVANPSPNTISWQTNELRLYKLSFEQAIKDVAEYFGKNISVENPDINSCGVSITLPFKNPEIQNVLKAISKTINAQLVEENGKYIIKGGNCPH